MNFAGAGEFSGMSPSTSLVGVMQDRLRAKHYSPRTEEAYVGWVRR